MQIKKEIALELLDLYKGDTTESWEDINGNELPLKFELVQDKLVDTTRWSHIHERTYKDLNTGKFWQTTYSVGATECQDESPYEWHGAVIELVEVEPVETIKIEYKVVK